MLFCLSVLTSLCQTVLSGTISDSSGKTIAYASVSIFNIKTEAGIYFTKSDEKGFYRLLIPDTLRLTNLAIRAISIGYRKEIKAINVPNTFINFRLNPDAQQLPNVIVKNTDAKIRIKSDTLTYNTADFADKSDKFIVDIIRKIPGIEIETSGRIKYQGRFINYFYIDGDNILDEKYSIATKNIPQEIVEKIQVIENNQHIKMLNGIVPSESPAINITLKDKARINFINSSRLGLGTETVKEGEINSLAFKSKFKAINILRYNNSGIDPAEDVASHGNTDIYSIQENRPSIDLVNLGIAGTPSINKNRYLFNNAGLLNINDFLKTKKDLSFRVNAYYLPDKQERSYTFSSNYYLPADTVTYVENQHIRSNLRNLHALVNININTTKRYVNNSLTIDYSTTHNAADLITSRNSVSQQLNSAVKGFTNYANGLKLLANGKFIEFYSLVSYNNRPQDLSVSPGLHQEILNGNKPFSQSIQHIAAPVFFTNNYISYKTANGILFQSYRMGFLIQKGDLNSTLTLQQVDNTVTALTDSFSNQLHWQKNKFYTEAEYRLDIGRNSIRLTIPAGYSIIKQNNVIFNTRYNVNRFMLTPFFLWRHKVGRENILSAGYRFDTQLSNMNENYPGIILTNYQSLISNNIPIQQTYTNTYNVGMDLRKSIKLLFLNISGTYMEKRAGFLYASTLQNNIIQRKVLSIPNTIYQTSISTGISKYLFSIRSTILARHTLQFSTNLQLQNNLLFPITNISNHLTTGITARPNSQVSITYEMLQIWSLSKTTANSSNKQFSLSTYHNKQFLELVISPTDRLSIKLKNEHYYYKASEQPSSSLYFADVSVQYSLPKKPIGIELICSNLGNSKQLSTISTSENSISSFTYMIRPRFLLLRASFHL